MRTSGGRRAAVAAEGAAVMKYSRSSHHPVSQPQGRWSLKGGMERGGGEQTLLWILQMVSLREFGKCPDNLIVLISGASSTLIYISSYFLVCSGTIEERREEVRSSRRKKGRTDSTRPLLNGGESRGPSERWVQ